MFEMIIVAFLMDGNTVVQKETFNTVEECKKGVDRAHYFVSQIETTSFRGGSFQCINSKDKKVIIEKFYNITK